MGRVRVTVPKPSRAHRAQAGLLAGGGLLTAGVAELAGTAWALLTAGALLVTYFLALYDADEPEAHR